MTTPGSQPAQRVRRWCARAAVVLGGAVAGSAAAWLLSTAGAQAAPVDDDPFGGVNDVKQAARQLTELPAKAADTVRGTADRAAEALRVNHRPHQPAERPEGPGDEPRQESPRGHHESGPLGDLGELLSGVLGGDPQADLPAAPQAPGCEPRFADWCERITGWFTPPKPGELVPSLPGASETVPPALGGAEPPTLLPLPVHDVAAGQSATPAAWPVDGDVVQRIDHALRSHEQTAHHHNFPGKHTPLGAPGQPAVMAPGSGSALAGHADGSHMAITAAAAAAAAGGATLALRRSIPGSSRIGGQPGVTPD